MTMGPDKEAADELRMRAYYYGFAATGIPEIDRILSAVACAGKAFHHTEDWHLEAEPFRGHAGSNPIEWIQNAANDAAKAASEIAALRRRVAQYGRHLNDCDTYIPRYNKRTDKWERRPCSCGFVTPAGSDTTAPLKMEGGTPTFPRCPDCPDAHACTEFGGCVADGGR